MKKDKCRCVDYIIVGAGTAGCPLAKFLTDDLKTNVLVLEPGENRATDPRVQQGHTLLTPFGDTTIWVDPKYSWYRSADPALNRPQNLTGESATDGRLWGGSSGHNGLYAARGSSDVYDTWGAVNPQWSYNNLLPLMKTLETYTPNGTVANPAQRGSAGPLFVTQDPPLDNTTGFYTVISAQTNAPATTDYNDPTLGVVSVSASQWFSTPMANTRSWAQSAFLPPTVVTADGQGVGGRKLELLSRATVVEVIIEEQGSNLVATGVRYFLGNDPSKTLTAFAKKKVILCAGTIATPKLLQLSGVGPAALLTSLGIPVKLDNPNVGRNMQNHTQIGASIPIGLPGLPSIFEVGSIYTDGSGTNPSNLQPNDGVRRNQFITIPLPIGLALPDELLGALNLRLVPNVFFSAELFRPAVKTGTIEINSKDPLAEPTIKPNFYTDSPVIIPTPWGPLPVPVPGTDIERVVQQYKTVANISLAWTGMMPLYPPASHYPAPEYPLGNPAVPFFPDAALVQDALDWAGLVDHAVGSCQMAASAVTGVVDGNLDVFGIKRLSIADNSIQPKITTANTAWPAFIIGMKKAQIEGAVV